MLVLRMQRTGRSGHAQFRVIVQDNRFSPTSGRVVAYVGSYNPHTKAVTLDKEKIVSYLSNGVQPSPRVTAILKKEGIKLPGWVKVSAPGKKSVKHPEKLRRNRPAGEPASKIKPEAEEVLAGEAQVEKAPAEKPAESEAKRAEEKAEPETSTEETVVGEGVKPVKDEKEESEAEAKS